MANTIGFFKSGDKKAGGVLAKANTSRQVVLVADRCETAALKGIMEIFGILPTNEQGDYGQPIRRKSAYGDLPHDLKSLLSQIGTEYQFRFIGFFNRDDRRGGKLSLEAKEKRFTAFCLRLKQVQGVVYTTILPNCSVSFWHDYKPRTAKQIDHLIAEYYK